jgi:hypothetical protein
VALDDIIKNFVILDIIMISSMGDHMICSSHPIFISNDNERISYEEHDCDFYKSEVKTDKYQIFLFFKFMEQFSTYSLDKIILKIQKDLVQSIFKKND